MGGTDKKNFMRGLFTVCRRSKKWWKSLWYWVLDASMYNAFVLHRWCWRSLHPRSRYRMTYARFIRQVAEHFVKSPDQQRVCTPRCAVRRRGVPLLDLSPDSPASAGMHPHPEYKPDLKHDSKAQPVPAGKETNSPVTTATVCKGADLEKRVKLHKDGSQRHSSN